jgi:uncharacterized coiled-coil DUF342 family protein
MRETRQLREDLESKLQSLTGELGAFKDIDDIALAVNHIEKKLETEGAGSLKQEKEFLRRRKLLESAKDQIKQLQPLRGQIDMCSDKENESLQEAKLIQSRLDELNTKLRDAASAKASQVLPTKSQDEVKKLKEERDELRKNMNKVHEEMDQIRQEFRDEETAFRTKMDSWRVLLEAAKVEREKDRARRDEERAKKQAALAEIRKLNPYEAEIDLCNTLIRYLEEKLSIGKAQPKRQADTRVDPALSLFKKSDGNDGEGFNIFTDRRKTLGLGKTHTKPKDRNAPAQPRKAEESKDQPLKLDIHRMMSFERLGMEAPRLSSQGLKALQALKEKKQHYETFVRNEEEAKEAVTATSPTGDAKAASPKAASPKAGDE